MRKRVAIVGGGIAGIAAAELLQPTHDVTLFEASARLGGHANPTSVHDPEAGPLDLDTAFLILNPAAYPLFLRLLRHWGLPSIAIETEMSFLIHDPRAGVLYAVNHGWIPRLGSVRSLADPKFLGIFPAIQRFRSLGSADLRSGAARGLTLGQYLEQRAFTRTFIDHFILPIAAAVWSVPTAEVLGFEAETFLAFYAHHGYLDGLPSARWHTLQGSSRRYLEAFHRGFLGALRLSTPVHAVRRLREGGVELATDSGPERYDQAVLATHADVTRRILADPLDLEARLLRPWRYRRVRALLHTDSSLLPMNKRLWSSWNILRDERGEEGITYWLNRVQRLRAGRDYFLSMGGREPRGAATLAQFEYDHPIFESAATATQPELPALNSATAIAFCGSYFGYGFHEDAIRSAVSAAAALGADTSAWRAP